MAIVTAADEPDLGARSGWMASGSSTPAKGRGSWSSARGRPAAGRSSWSGRGVHRVAVDLRSPVDDQAGARRPCRWPSPGAPSTSLELDFDRRRARPDRRRQRGLWPDRPRRTARAARLSAHLSPRSRVDVSWAVDAESGGRNPPLLTAQGDIAIDIDPGADADAIVVGHPLRPGDDADAGSPRGRAGRGHRTAARRPAGRGRDRGGRGVGPADDPADRAAPPRRGAAAGHEDPALVRTGARGVGSRSAGSRSSTPASSPGRSASRRAPTSGSPRRRPRACGGSSPPSCPRSCASGPRPAWPSSSSTSPSRWAWTSRRRRRWSARNPGPCSASTAIAPGARRRSSSSGSAAGCSRWSWPSGRAWRSSRSGRPRSSRPGTRPADRRRGPATAAVEPRGLTIRLAPAVRDQSKVTLRLEGLQRLPREGPVKLGLFAPDETTAVSASFSIAGDRGLSVELDDEATRSGRGAGFRAGRARRRRDPVDPRRRRRGRRPGVGRRGRRQPPRPSRSGIARHARSLRQETLLSAEVSRRSVDLLQKTTFTVRHGTLAALEIRVPPAIVDRWELLDREVVDRRTSGPRPGRFDAIPAALRSADAGPGDPGVPLPACRSTRPWMPRAARWSSPGSPSPRRRRARPGSS